jgi:hypothetical protein
MIIHVLFFHTGLRLASFFCYSFLVLSSPRAWRRSGTWSEITHPPTRLRGAEELNCRVLIQRYMHTRAATREAPAAWHLSEKLPDRDSPRGEERRNAVSVTYHVKVYHETARVVLMPLCGFGVCCRLAMWGNTSIGWSCLEWTEPKPAFA